MSKPGMSSPALAARRRVALRRVISTFSGVFLTVMILGALSYWTARASENHGEVTLTRRHPVYKENEECHLVHRARDKCAFVRDNCLDEEPGYLSYLRFYYCYMATLKPIGLTVIALWLSLLFSTIGLAASDFFSVNLSSFATMAGMSENLAGVTLLAFGNGSPDVFSTFAAMKNNSGSLAIGELIGAAGFITSVIAGSMAFIRPFNVPRKSFLRDVTFFIVAASFSLAFLADGKLHLWECILLVVLYIIYVLFVVGSHWYSSKSQSRRCIEAAARSQYSFSGTDAIDINEEYRDLEEDRDRRDVIRTNSGLSDVGTLEMISEAHEDEDEHARERLRGQLSSQMRLRRPRASERRNTHDPIRPSLLGALEFNSVLSGLQKSGNLQVFPLRNRDVVEDPRPNLAQDRRATVSEPYQIHELDDPESIPSRPSVERTASGNRIRAGSTFETNPVRSQAIPKINLSMPSQDQSEEHNAMLTCTAHSPSQNNLPSPIISISAPPAEAESAEAEFVEVARRTAAQATATHQQPRNSHKTLFRPQLGLHTSSTGTYPSGTLSPDMSQFPPYSDESFPASPTSRRPSSAFRLPLPALPSNSDTHLDEQQSRPLPGYPYWLFPAPSTVASTLFPTLYTWSDKSIWGKAVALCSAPSIFLLTLTLPVVELEKRPDDVYIDASVSHTTALSQTPLCTSGSDAIQQPETDSIDGTVVGVDVPHGLHISAEPYTSSPDTPVSPFSRTANPTYAAGGPQDTVAQPQFEDDDWNRWLVIVHFFTAPLFCVIIAWTSIDTENLMLLAIASLVSISLSVAGVIFILTTTRPDKIPRWHGLLCVLGFCVSIAWISTIAGEVVGVLKALGVILNISDAILGLTVFAVGNSLGDLVANVTVARLGYPVMALSACFGGPMLNILLGIGLSGGYMTIRKAEERAHKHPWKRLHIKPYVVDVDRTLLISGIALLVTLLGLLVIVPYRGWMIDRVIGWGLILLWLVATIGNLLTEILIGQVSVS